MQKGKLERIRFNKDGTRDFEIKTEDGKKMIAKSCMLHINKEKDQEHEGKIDRYRYTWVV